MVTCRQCAFQENDVCKYNPPAMVINYIWAEERFTDNGQNTGYYTTMETRFPQVIFSETHEVGGCWKGKLRGTYQREIL